MACNRTNSLGAENNCKCTFTDCERWGKCCSCVLFHRTKGEIPGCFFSADAEKAGYRDAEHLIMKTGVSLHEEH